MDNPLLPSDRGWLVNQGHNVDVGDCPNCGRSVTEDATQAEYEATVREALAWVAKMCDMSIRMYAEISRLKNPK